MNSEYLRAASASRDSVDVNNMAQSRYPELPKQVQVAIVGAGLSGLWAGVTLTRLGYEVAIVEARNRVGGRILSSTVDGTTLDMGAQWIGPTQSRMYALCRELGLMTFPTVHAGQKILELDGRIKRYSGSVPKLNPIALFELHRLIRRTETDIAKLGSFNGRSGSKIHRLDAQTVGEWARNTIRSRSVLRVLETAVRVIFGAEINELSLFYFLRYCQAGGGLMKLCEIENAAQQDRIMGGSQAIVQKLHERALSQCVYFSAPVRQIAQEQANVKVYTDRGCLTAQRVIVAIAPPLASRIRYQPKVSSGRDRLTQRMSMGSTIKCHAVYDTPFWRRAGFSGEVVSNGDPITVVFDNSVPGHSWGLLGFIVGLKARRWGNEIASVRRRSVLEAFARYFGPQALEPKAYVDHDWGCEEWSRGCPIANAPTNVLSVDGDHLWKPEGRIHWAGTETASEWTGFMEGALESAERAAQEVHRELG